MDLDLGDMDRCFDILRAESFGVAFGEAVKEDPDSFGPHIKENVALGSDHVAWRTGAGRMPNRPAFCAGSTR